MMPPIPSDRSAYPDVMSASTLAGRRSYRRSAPVLIMSTISRELALDQQSRVRPEVVARGHALAADPNYPSMDVLRKVAAEFLASHVV